MTLTFPRRRTIPSLQGAITMKESENIHPWRYRRWKKLCQTARLLGSVAVVVAVPLKEQVAPVLAPFW